MHIYLLYGDDNSGWILGAIFGLIIWLVIIYNIIASATRAKKIESHLFLQSLILKEMALKNGVSQERINELVETAKKMQ